MIPNITTGKGFRGLLSYLLTDKETGLPRPEASLIGGTLFGRTVGQLATEFDLIRRLRPQAEEGVVLHHSLSYAPTENPTDEQIIRDAERYLEHMGLGGYPHAIVCHRDKECVHAHIVISRVGTDGSWANTWYDQLKAQKAAAFVEKEFGLVPVERPKMQDRIEKEWAKLLVERPDIKEAAVAAPLARPELWNESGIKKQIRQRLEGLPVGLSLPEWIEAAELEGLHLVPNMGTDKLTGWTVQLKGTESKPIALGKCGLSWPKLLEAGKVLYNPDEHFAFALKCKEIKHDKPAVALGPQPEAPIAGPYPRDGRTLNWDWQPGDIGLPEPEEPSLVELVVGPSLRPGAFRREFRTPSVAQVRVRQPEGAACTPRPAVGSDWRSIAHLAPSVHASVARVRGLYTDRRYADSAGPREHLAHRGPIGGSHGWAQPASDQPARRPGSVARMHDSRPAPTGADRHGDLHHQPLGGFPAPSRGGAGRGARGVGVGRSLDWRGLEALKLPEIVKKAMEPFREILREIISPLVDRFGYPRVQGSCHSDAVRTAASEEWAPIELDLDDTPPAPPPVCLVPPPPADRQVARPTEKLSQPYTPPEPDGPSRRR